ncbi:MAG TPA: integrase core domain-containing protein [Vicinamibacterales bacterium]|nr:integrase core domain-containing protein [Vicinamibacterales bacterium]
MPWKDTCPMDQRVAFIADWLRDEWTMSELAVRYGISRKTAYKWIDRYERDPEHGLAEHSRAPKQHGRAMAENVRAAVRALRRAHPRRGPRKLRAILMERDGRRDWPAASTIGDLLRREGLSAPRRRRREIVPLTQPLAAAQTPNDVWTADFKGWFRTTDGTRCDPLTVIDACSRFVLCCRIVAPTERGVRPWFERTFREYGLPRAMRTDNGPPFATTAAAHLSPLAIWWLKLGIQLDRIDRGHPEQNGRHERFHLTLQESTTTPPAATSVQQQRRFDRLRSEFNTERPHEALGQQPPARVYVASPRPYPARLEEPSYDASHQVRYVRHNGHIKWHGDLVFVSRALRGEPIGLAETEHGDWIVRFMRVDLGCLDRHTRRFTPTWHGPRVRR